MINYPEVGDLVNITPEGGTLPFEVVKINKRKAEPILIRHPLSGGVMWFRRRELSPHVRSDHR